ncbi:MAG: SPOR domain-containing protein [Gammaproteobacteria bacterium]|nr:SPOR domain-containing protein [Gammaproteobacteria bacterium]MBU1646884.1 SPOR domain-containing protein [Gammaproteobacteria bacterium]MBU1971145.1 SPOR domain-containing protein [Gammaproteobacteria bacterium]
MSELKQESATPAQDEEVLKKRLLNRLAIAGVVVVALLGSLAVFDAMYVAPPPPQPVAKALPPAEPLREEAPTVATEPQQVASQEVAKEEPVVVPENTAIPARPMKPLTPPATARQATIRPSQPQAMARPDPSREIAETQATTAGSLSKPLARAAQSARQYVLQMGVFHSVANAEELRAKLELNGIPAQIEARVQVGPFKTREEAAAAREKLRAIGLDNGILTAIGK